MSNAQDPIEPMPSSRCKQNKRARNLLISTLAIGATAPCILGFLGLAQGQPPTSLEVNTEAKFIHFDGTEKRVAHFVPAMISRKTSGDLVLLELAGPQTATARSESEAAASVAFTALSTEAQSPAAQGGLQLAIHDATCPLPATNSDTPALVFTEPYQPGWVDWSAAPVILDLAGSGSIALPMTPFDDEQFSPPDGSLLEQYAELPEVPSISHDSLPAIHNVQAGDVYTGDHAGDNETIHPAFFEPMATEGNLPSLFNLAGLNLAEVQNSARISAATLSSESNSPISQATAPEHREPTTQMVESMLHAIGPNQPLATLKPIQPPAWFGQIHFAMLRYARQTDLSLQDAIYTAIQFSPEIQVLRADVGISEAEVAKQNAVFDWNSFVQSNWDERNVPVSSNLDGAFNRLENHTLANSGGLRKQGSLGGAMRLAQELGFADSNSTFFRPENQASARLAIEYQQPLLQGAGLLVTKSRINIAITNAGVSHEQLLSGMQLHILSVINAYWELAARRGEFIIHKRSYERALETASVVSNRAHLDVGPVQSARSEATLSARRAALINAEFAVVLTQEKLLRLMFGPCFREAVNAEVIPTSNMVGPSRAVDMEMELQAGLQCRPEVRRSLKEIRRTSIEQGVARNQLLPLLGLTMSVSNKGLQGNNGLASAFNDQFNLGDPTYGVGVAYELPVGNRAAKANLRQAQIRLCRFQKQFETVVSDVALEIRNAAHNLNLAAQQREATKQALALAERELEVLKARAELLLDGDNVGPLYLDDLLTTQQRLAIAEQSFLDACAKHALAYFELQRATGVLLQCSDISGAQF